MEFAFDAREVFAGGRVIGHIVGLLIKSEITRRARFVSIMSKPERATRGGKREGSGRKTIGPKPRSELFTARVTTDEFVKLKEFLSEIRKPG